MAEEFIAEVRFGYTYVKPDREFYRTLQIGHWRTPSGVPAMSLNERWGEGRWTDMLRRYNEKLEKELREVEKSYDER